MVARDLRVVSLNVRAGGAPRATAITEYMRSLRPMPDVIVVGESYPSGSRNVTLDALGAAGWDCQVRAHSDLKVAWCVALASRRPLLTARQPITSGENRQRVIEAHIDDVLLVGAYFPLAKPKVEFWRHEFLPYAETRLDEDALLIGDWNSGSHYIDEKARILDGAREFETLSAMGWIDAWRSRHPEAREFSWYSKPYNNGFRIDHAFASPSLDPRVTGVRYDHRTREWGISDHSALIVDIRRPDTT